MDKLNFEKREHESFKDVTFQAKPVRRISPPNGFYRAVIWLAQSDQPNAKKLRWLGYASFALAAFAVKQLPDYMAG